MAPACPEAVSLKSIYMGVSKNSGTPKWMVYNGKPYYSKLDDLGVPLFLETPIYIHHHDHHHHHHL